MGVLRFGLGGFEIWAWGLGLEGLRVCSPWGRVSVSLGRDHNRASKVREPPIRFGQKLQGIFCTRTTLINFEN